MARREPVNVIVASSTGDTQRFSHLENANSRLVHVSFSLDSVIGDVAVLVVDGESDSSNAISFLKAIRMRSGEDGPPTIFLAPSAKERETALPFADAVLVAPCQPLEILAQVRSFLRWHDSRERLRDRMEEVGQFNQRLQQAYDQINLDLVMAGRLQSSFLPHALPQVGNLRFHVHYQPHGPIGGDFYDVMRLDERHVGFYLADTMGHGVPASLLTVYLKMAVIPKDISHGTYRIVPPHEVLARLNKDLVAQELAELPFVTMVYGVIDAFSGELQICRGAHPHPIFVPAKGPPEVWQMPGSILGVFDAVYESQSRRLLPGDKLLLTTDGLPQGGDSSKDASILEATAAVNRLPLEDFVDGLVAHLFDGEKAADDDVTLLALEYE